MQLRTSARLLASAGALLLAATLSSCGFDYATDRVYTPAAGVNNRDADVDVLGAVVVAAQDDSGTFIASFANNLQDEAATVDSMTSFAGTDADAASSAPLKVKAFDPIQIPPGGLVNLASVGGIPVSGTFTVGQFVTVNITFGDGESVEVQVPTVTNCGEFAGLDTSKGSKSADATDQCGATGAPAAE
jgi:hypothetical protein